MFGQIVNNVLSVSKNDDIKSSLQDNNKIEGKIKFFNQEKGFGFIYTNKSEDHFFNVKDVDGFDLPNQGDIVEFETNSGKKGLFATQIIITSSKKDEGKTTCPSCKEKVIPKTINNPRKQVSPSFDSETSNNDSLGGRSDFGDCMIVDSWQNAYVSGNCPLCGYEIWKN